MRVIRCWLGRLGWWSVQSSLSLAEALLRAMLGFSAGAARLFEAWRQKVESRRAARVMAAARIAKAANRWRTAFEEAPLGMARLTLDGRIEEVNAAFRSLVGEPQHALAGRRLSALVHPDDLAALNGPGNPGNAANSGKQPARVEVRVTSPGGRLRWSELASCIVNDPSGRPDYILVSAVDITRHKKSQAALADLATRDPLSGLANRRSFELQLAQHLSLCRDQGPRGAVLVLDLDDFKVVNDTFGHQSGDRLINDVAVTLRRHLRDQDLLARLGGDEFAVVLREGDRWAAEAVARKLVLAVRDEIRARPTAAGDAVGGGAAQSWAEPDIDLVEHTDAGDRGSTVSKNGASAAKAPAAGGRPAGGRWRRATGGQVRQQSFGVSVSIGVAPLEVLAGTLDFAGTSVSRDVLRAADAALYEVKRSGRNGYSVSGAQEGPRHARRQPSSVPDLSAGPQAGRAAGRGAAAASSDLATPATGRH